MATGTTFKQRDLLKEATIEIKIINPPHHRFMFWLGSRVMAFGAVIAGMSFQVEDES